MSKGRIPEKIIINEPGVYVNADLFIGSDEYKPFGVVAHAYIEAPGRGRETLKRLHEKLQQIADEFGVRVSHLAEPDTAEGTLFLRRIRNEGKILQEEAYIYDRRFFVETFKPRT